jgi:hypothetical protein
VNQLGIATTLIDTLLIGVVGALSIAFGLAFGLGGRDRAAQVLDSINRNLQQAGPKLERAATAAQPQAQGMAQQAQAGSGTQRPAMGNGWVERAMIDRRRVDRPGLKDRRRGGEIG